MTFPVWAGNNEALVSQQITSAPSFTNYTALAGGASDGSPVLTAHINLIDTVATDGDSAMLPPADAAGKTIQVVNWSGTENGVTLYPHGDDTLIGSSSQSVGPYASYIYLCNVIGNWIPISYITWD